MKGKCENGKRLMKNPQLLSMSGKGLNGNIPTHPFSLCVYFFENGCLAGRRRRVYHASRYACLI